MTSTHIKFKDISDPIIAIMGPTAAGKTDVACQLYDMKPSAYDIISVDSALVYKDMNIGTAKPSEAELAQYPHALVDIINPTESYSAASFAKDATILIKQSHDAGKTPILVGGTMLYFKALFGGFDDIPASQPAIREQLHQSLKEVGLSTLYERLETIDPVTALKLNKTDTQRILRALEVYNISGKPLSYFQTGTQPTLPACWKICSLQPERTWLHERIEKRLELMWEQGFLQEVQSLLSKYVIDEETTSMRAVGYRQVLEYLKNTDDINNNRQMMQDKALFATRQLAKRQYTWLRKFENLYHVNTRTFKMPRDAIDYLI